MPYFGRKFRAKKREGSPVIQLGSSAAFDAATISQVLHHLEDGTDASWPAHAAVLGKMRRVLRPAGVLVVNICNHDQLRHGYWYCDLVSGAREAGIRRHISTEQFTFTAEVRGFDGVAGAAGQGRNSFRKLILLNDFYVENGACSRP
jgi:SAM-dependent methyltransferase